MQFDLKNGNTLWREATNLEMLQLAEYDTFRDLGNKDTAYHLQQDTRRSVPILSMTASMTADTRHGWLPMVTSRIFLWRACTPLYPYVGYELLLSLPNSMVLTSGLQISVMLIWKLLPWNKIISL
jgi:hypothetical protein